MADADLYSLLMGDEPSPADQARAQAAALRGQQVAPPMANSPDLIFSMGQNPVTQTLGKEAIQSAHQQALMQRYADLADYHNRAKFMRGKNGEIIATYPTGEVQTVLDAPAPQPEDKVVAGGLYRVEDGKARQLVAPPPRPARTQGGAGGAATSWSPAAIDQAARIWEQTGQFPNVGRDQGARTAIQNRHAELFPDSQLVLNKANYGADTKSLGHMQQQADAVNSFTRTFDKNVGILENSLAGLDSSDIPLINKGYRAWQGAKGSPALTAFQNSLNTVRSELGKINSGSTGQGGVPITLLQEMEHGLPENATPQQVLAALKVYRQDSENRRAAMAEQLSEIRGRMGGKKAESTPGAQPARAPSSGAPTAASHPQAGAALAWAKANPSDPDAIKILKRLGATADKTASAAK